MFLVVLSAAEQRIFSQDGLGFSGVIAPRPLDDINLTCHPVPSKVTQVHRFFGGVFDGQHVWLVPRSANVTKIDTHSGIWSHTFAWPASFTPGGNMFSGGAFVERMFGLHRGMLIACSRCTS